MRIRVVHLAANRYHVTMNWLANLQRLRRTATHLLPSLCLLCHNDTRDHHGSSDNLCSYCERRTFRFIKTPCATCGLPLPARAKQTQNLNQICGTCLIAPPPWQRCVAPVRYTPRVAQLIVAAKHKESPGWNRALSDLLWHGLRQNCVDTEGLSCLLPVPTTYRKILFRGHNLPTMLARGLSRYSGRPVNHHVRHSTWIEQRGRSAAARGEHIEHRFAVYKRLQGHVGIIDDVMTTGATLRAMSHAARAAGAQSISVFALARVLTPGMREDDEQE